MNKEKWFSRWPFYIGLFLYFALGFSTLAWGEHWAAILYPEDHYFENVGAISLFVASAISLVIFLRAFKNRNQLKIHWLKLLVYLGLAGLYFFGGGEEISWGQRIFHIQEPASLAAENVQGEINVHNLAIFEKSELVKGDTIFTVFWIGFAVLLPLGSFLSSRFKDFAVKFTPIVHWMIGLSFIVNYLFAKVAKVLFQASYTYSAMPFKQAVQEVKESNYELLFVFLSLIVLWDLSHMLIGAKEKAETSMEKSAFQQPAA